MIQIRKAARQKTKLRLGMSGPSGSGKSYSALLLAKGLVEGRMEKVAIIDTENGSADLYSHLGEYNVIPLEDPYTPEKYIEAIQACEKAGMELVIIDSVSHEWDGKGGLLESNELVAQSRFKGNSWAAWSVTTPRHQKFLEAIKNSKLHIITTARSKTDTIQTEDKKIKKVGLKEIQREGFEFELTLNFTLDRDGHFATASKDRTSIFENKDPFMITSDTGKTLKEWSEQGVEPGTAPVVINKEAIEQENKDKAAKELLLKKNKLLNVLKSLGYDPKTREGAAIAIKETINMEFKDELIDEITEKLGIIFGERKDAGITNTATVL